MTSAAIPEQAGRAQTATRVAKLFERHGRMVYGVCRAMLRDSHEVEDATQQTFLSAHRALLGGARVRDEGAWLATIARNECRARISAGMRRPLSLGEDDLALMVDPIDELQRRSQAEALRHAFADLPERQREAVVLRDVYGLRYGEVAKALGLSRPATEALLFRARRAMRRRLRPVVTTALVVPLSIQEGLAQALPGFASAGSGGVAAGVAGGGLLAKLTAGPVGVKVATAAVAATTVGAVGSVEPERAGRDRTEQPAIVSVGDVRFDDETRSGSSGRGRGSADHGTRGDDDGNSGSGSGKDRDGNDDSSGPGSRGEKDDPDGVSSGREVGDDDDSSGSGSETDATHSSSSGSGSGGSATEDSPGPTSSGPDDSPELDDDPEGHGSSGGSSSSGSSSGSGSGDADSDRDSSRGGSGDSGSSGQGSGDAPDDLDD